MMISRRSRTFKAVLHNGSDSATVLVAGGAEAASAGANAVVFTYLKEGLACVEDVTPRAHKHNSPFR